MNILTLLQIFSCIFIASITTYFYIDKQNQLTHLRLEIPALNKELKEIKEENKHITYEIEQFESPVHLIELSRNPEFSHLKYPYLNQVIILKKESNTP